MNIVHFSICKPHRFRGAGISKFVYGISEAQARLGHKVTVVYYSDKDNHEIPPGVRVVRYERHFARFLLPNKLKRDLVADNIPVDFGHLHCGYFPEMIAVARYLESRNIPYCFTPHGSLAPLVRVKDHVVLKEIYRKMFQLRMVNRAAYVHVLSKGEKLDVEKYGVRSPLKIIKQGFDFEDMPGHLDKGYWRKRFPEHRNKFKLVYLGRIDPLQKGLDVLIESLRIVKTKHPEKKFVFYMIGSDYEGGIVKLKKQIRVLDLEDEVVFCGSIHGPDKYHALAGADLFVHPSRWEGMPFSLIEALSVSVPVLVTPGVYLTESIRDYDAGYTVNLSAQSLFQGLIRAIDASTEELRRMGNNGCDLIKTEFSWQRTAKAICDCYQKHLTGRGN